MNNDPSSKIKALEDTIALLQEQLNDLKLSTGYTRIDESDSSSSKSSEVPLLDRLRIVLDLETTGIGKSSEIGIHDIGAIAVDKNWNKIDQFQRYVDPEREYSQKAMEMNGRVKDNAYNWKVVGKEFYNWINGIRVDQSIPVDICTFNGKSYDMRIITFRNWEYKLEWPKNINSVDFRYVLKDFYKLPNQKRQVDYYKYIYEEDMQNSHTALGDCKGLLSIIQDLFDNYSPNLHKYRESIHAIIKRCKK